MLETAVRIVTKCYQILVWATNSIPKDRTENEFGRPNLGWGYRMFSAYLRLISKIKLFRTAWRTWGNNIVVLRRVLPLFWLVCHDFRPCVAYFCLAKKHFREPDLSLTLYKSIRMYRDETKWNEMSHTIDFTVKAKKYICVFPVSRPTLIFRATLNILLHS